MRIEKKDVEIFENHHIHKVDEIEYTNFNIVIGENGAGKSRFLKALKEYYINKDLGQNNIIYADFSKIHIDPENFSNYVPKNSDSSDIIDVLMHNQKFSFEDFLSEIEKKSIRIIEDIIYYLDDRSKIVRQNAQETMDLFIEMINKFCKRNINVDSNNILVKDLRNRLKEPLSLHMALAEMSPGEVILFYISIFLCFLLKYNNRNIVIILDEPELHLHPKILIDFVKKLEEISSNAITWIATHSIFLIPEFEFENIVYINNNTIERRNSFLYENILVQLLGKNETIEKFFSSLDNWIYYNFMFECFLDPTSVDKADINDPQFQQFLYFIKDKNIINVLDYGGGSGRIAKCIDKEKKQKNSGIDKLKYSIFDKSPDSKSIKSINCKYYDESQLDELMKNENSYDCIILMNTLHEIKINEWVEVINRIHKLLSENGYLLYIEVKTLQHGEKPNDSNGYIFLDKEQLYILFDTDNIGEVIIGDEKKSKSNCYIIQKTYLNNISDITLYNTMQNLERYTFEKLEKSFKAKISSSDDTFKENNIPIKEYAFLSQLYINVLMYNKTCERKNLGLNKQQEYNGAIIAHNKIIGRNPNNAIAYNDRGNTYYNEKEYDKAISDYTKAIELDPNYALAYNNRGVAYNYIEEYNKAISDYTKAIILDPSYAIAYNNRGDTYYNKKEYDKAISDYTKAIEFNPNYAIAYNNRGVVYNDIEEYDRAIADYTKAIEFNPNYAIAYNNRGVAHGSKREYDRAISDYTKAIEFNPNYAIAYNNRGVVYNDIEEYDRAIADYTKAIEFNPNYAIAYNNRGYIYYNEKEYDKAIVDYTKAIEFDPNYALAYRNRGNAYYSKKEYDRAISDYMKVIELDPNDVSAYNNRGVAYGSIKEYDRAISDYTKAIELDQNNVSAYNNRGIAHGSIKEYDRAISDYTKAIEFNPNYASAYYNRGVAYDDMKDYDRAVADYTKAIELDPNNERVPSLRKKINDIIRNRK